MNFLAHTSLSGDSNAILVGNFIADSVKGNPHDQYKHDKDIVEGIILHRNIDRFTDQHVTVKKSIKRLRHNYGKYAGILVDIFYDHFLAKNWNLYHDTTLEEHAEQVYDVLELYKPKLPQNIQKFLPAMIHHNWLVNYGKFWGIERALESISRRAKFPNTMNRAMTDLKKDYKEFDREFKLFYPYVQEYVKRYLAGELE